MNIPLYVAVALVVIPAIILFIMFSKAGKKTSGTESNAKRHQKEDEYSQNDTKRTNSSERYEKGNDTSEGDQKLTDKGENCVSFRAGNDPVLSVSEGKGVIATCVDESHYVTLFRTDDLTCSEIKEGSKNIRKQESKVDIGFDYPTAISLSKDSSLLAVGIDYFNTIRMFKLTIPEPKKEMEKDGKTIKSISLPSIKFSLYWKETSQRHNKVVSQIEFSSNNSWIASCCNEEDRIYFWSVKDGELLLRYNLGQLNIEMFSVSPDSRFISTASFTSNVCIYEVICEENDVKNFQLKKYKEFKAHSSSISHVSFHMSSELLSSCSKKDGKFKIFSARPLRQAVDVKETDAVLYEGKSTEIDRGYTQGIERILYSKSKPDMMLTTYNNREIAVIRSKSSHNKKDYKKGEAIHVLKRFKVQDKIQKIYLGSSHIIVGCSDGVVRLYEY